MHLRPLTTRQESPALSRSAEADDRPSYYSVSACAPDVGDMRARSGKIFSFALIVAMCCLGLRRVGPMDSMYV